MEFLVFVTLCIAVATLIVVATLSGKNKKTDQKIDGLHQAVGTLHYKVDVLHRSSSALAKEHASATAATKSDANAQAVKQAEEQKLAASPQPSPTPAQQQNMPAATSPAQPARQAPAQQTAQPAQAPAAASTPTQQKPAASSDFAFLTQTHTQPVAPTQTPAQPTMQPGIASPQAKAPAPATAQRPQPQPYPYAQPQVPARKDKTNMEKIIGKNVLPFLAAGMVFIGLIFLAILVVPSMTAFQRFIGMFALSIAIFLVGLILAWRKKNIFSIALLGTGIGTLFISILMTRIYFNYLGDIPTFALLLVWMIICMGLVKVFNSLTLSITAHVGMAISIIFAFYQGFDQQRALIVIAYQVVATIVIVGGSLLAYRKTYRFGLVASLALTVVATIAIRAQNLAEFSTSVIVASYLIQFVTASALSFFLATSSAKLKKNERLGFHYANKAIWIILTILALWPAALQTSMEILYPHKQGLTNTQDLIVNTIPTLVCIVVFIVHALISALLERTISMPTDMVRVSIIGTIGAAAVLALYRMTLEFAFDGIIPVPFLFVLVLISLGIARLLRDYAYTIFGLVLLVIEVTLAVTSIFLAMSNMPAVLAFVWIVALMATSVAIYAAWQPAEKRRAFLPVLVILNLIFFELTLPQAVALTDTTFADDWTLSLAIVLLVLAVLRTINIEVLMGMTKDQRVAFAINEYVVAAIAVVTVGISGYHATVVTQILLWIVTALVIMMSFVRIIQSRNVSALHPKPIQYLSAIVLTLATQTPLGGLVRLGEAGPFVASVIAMFVALVLVGMGFALRLKPVRLYGLGLTIFAVLKLATYDLSNISPVGRVIAFIVGGLIAFGISALYNYADKRLDSSRAGKKNPAPTPYSGMPQAGTPQAGVPQGAMPQASMQQAGVPQGVPQGAPQPAMPQAGMPRVGVQQGQPMQRQPMPGQPTQVQPVQGRPAMNQPAPNRPTTGNPMPTQVAQGQPAQRQPMPAQPNPTQPTVQSNPAQPTTQSSATQPMTTQPSATQPQPNTSQAAPNEPNTHR